MQPNRYFTLIRLTLLFKMHHNPNAHHFHYHFYVSKWIVSNILLYVSNIQFLFPMSYVCFQYPIFVSNIRSMFQYANDVSQRQYFQCMFPIPGAPIQSNKDLCSSAVICKIIVKTGSSALAQKIVCLRVNPIWVRSPFPIGVFDNLPIAYWHSLMCDLPIIDKIGLLRCVITV